MNIRRGLWVFLGSQRVSSTPSCCASVIPVKSHFLLDNSHCSLAWCPISCLPLYPSDPSLANVSWPCLSALLVLNAETMNDWFVCWLSSLKTKEHLKIVGWRHIFVCKSLFQKKKKLHFFSSFFGSLSTFTSPQFRLEMFDHYSADANLRGWMWRLKP